jgi:hypothetical protein
MEREWVRTPRDSRATLRLRDGSRVEMKPHTEVGVSMNRQDVKVHLERGSIIVHAAERQRGHLIVATEDARVVVTGTVFSVNRGTVATELECGRLGQPAQTPLAGGVRGQAVQRDERIDRRNVDDGSATRPLHRADDRADTGEGPDRVDVEHATEVGQRCVLDRTEVQHGRVVDEDVDALMTRQYGGHQRLPRGLVGDVESMEHREVTELVGHRATFVLEKIGNDHVRAVVDETPSGHRTRAARGARDDGDLSLE